MKGYGRGYYGRNQLDPGRTSGWLKVAVIAGLGVAIWKLAPRALGIRVKTVEAPLPSSPPPAPSPPMASSELEQLALARGFSSTKSFEDSVVASARELMATGAKVVLDPRLQYLEARL